MHVDITKIAVTFQRDHHIPGRYTCTLRGVLGHVRREFTRLMTDPCASASLQKSYLWNAGLLVAAIFAGRGDINGYTSCPITSRIIRGCSPDLNPVCAESLSISWCTFDSKLAIRSLQL